MVTLICLVIISHVYGHYYFILQGYKFSICAVKEGTCVNKTSTEELTLNSNFILIDPNVNLGDNDAKMKAIKQELKNLVRRTFSAAEIASNHSDPPGKVNHPFINTPMNPQPSYNIHQQPPAQFRSTDCTAIDGMRSTWNDAEIGLLCYGVQSHGCDWATIRNQYSNVFDMNNRSEQDLQVSRETLSMELNRYNAN